ncbi:MAG: hypothetical protein RLZZ162_4002, partial [Verrucomicrobiota bacterium]
MKTLFYFAVLIAFARAAEPSPLDQPVGPLRFEKTPLPAALRALGRTGQTMIQAEAGITGEVTVDFGGGTVRAALTALLEPAGLFFEATASGIVVRQRQTVLYAIDYPQLTRSGSGSASITLGGATGGSGGNSHGIQNGAQQNLANGNTASDATQVSISQENQNTFWTNLEAELRTMLKEGDSLVLNRFSGVAQIAAPVKRHESI